MALLVLQTGHLENSQLVRRKSDVWRWAKICKQLIRKSNPALSAGLGKNVIGGKKMKLIYICLLVALSSFNAVLLFQ